MMAEAVVCPRCQAVMPVAGAAFCLKCGQRLEADEKTTGSSGSESARRVDIRPSSMEPPVAPGERYRLLSKLGEGGFGEVHRAFDVFLRREVALKVLKREAFDTERFLEETKISAQLEHPGIVPCYDAGQLPDGRLYYTMKLLGPRTLRDAIKEAKRGGSLPLKRRLQILVDVCHAIEFGHGLGVVHRDLKPENIMLGDHGEVCLLDFGIAKVLHDSRASSGVRALMTQEGTLMGTPAYAAPEQAAGDISKIDQRSDVYSLGVILYELLTLRLPFEGSKFEIMRKQMSETPPPPSSVAGDAKIPAMVEHACLRALALEKEERFAAAGDLARELQTYLDGVAEAEQRAVQLKLRLDEAREQLAEFEDVRARYEEANAQHQKRLRETPPGFEPEAWTKMNEAGSDVSALGRRKDEAMQRALTTLSAAHMVDPQSPEPRRLLASFWVQRLIDAEKDGRVQEAALSMAQALSYDSGPHAAILKGDGSVTISSEPPGAQVEILRCSDRPDGYRQEGSPMAGAKTPEAFMLPMGSYIAVVRGGPGYAEVRLPFMVRRGERVSGHVVLLSPEEVGGEERFAYIPGMTVYLARDSVAQAAERTVSVAGFCMAKYPVTMGEYLEFINDVLRADPKEARARGPRLAPSEGFYWAIGPDGRYALPESDVHGERHDPHWPIAGISLDDAEAFIAWRSAKDGRTYRLPTEDEWEVAARGADGRFYPFGDILQGTFANCGLGRVSSMAPVTAFPTDVSPFGIYGMCGGVADFTSTPHPHRNDVVITKGGNWFRPELSTRAAARGSVSRLDIVGINGIRLVHTPGRLAGK